MQTKREPMLYSNENQCCGCTACEAVCPKGAISFEYNSEGFLYPKVNKDKCIRCLLCEDVCAFKKDNKEEPEEETEVYGVRHKSEDIIKNSSSGGLFTALSDYYLDNGNSVASCMYDCEDDTVRLEIYDDKATRDKARGSKYIQPELGNAFKEIKNWLMENPEKELMVVGTGCQMAGLDSFLKKIGKRDRVLLVDLICHGVTSSGLWKKYISKLKGNKTLTTVTFKDKKYGWHYPRTYAVINGKEEKINQFSDWFYLGLSIRESCYVCPYTKTNRNSDITIGDYWGIEEMNETFADPMGVSLALIHSPRGNQVFEAIKEHIEWFKSDVESCSQPRLISPEKRPDNRDEFWEDMNAQGIAYCSKKYNRPDNNSFKNVFKRKLKTIMKRK